MMYQNEKQEYYSDGFYEIKDGRIWNPFSGRSLGFLVRTIPTNNYICVDEGRRKKRSWIKRIYDYFATDFVRMVQKEEESFADYVRETREGALADTMEGIK